MIHSIGRFLLFSNYLIGFLAIALSLETAIQLRLPALSAEYYALLFCGTVMYYTYAYTSASLSFSFGNPRSAWYHRHRQGIRISQIVLFMACLILSALWLGKNNANLWRLPLIDWLILLVTALALLMYYGLLPPSLARLNLRNTGWLKAIVIGFVWAACASLLPLIVWQVEGGLHLADPVPAIWLFVKNWIFCTMNAIMFDMKDYADDSNRDLKTFVVRFGLYRTIFFILIPLCLTGIFLTLLFARYRHFGILTLCLNLLPFLLTLAVIYSMQWQKNIFFYLIVIDGLVLLKALCGIAGMSFIPM